MERPDPDIKWMTKDGKTKKLGQMDINHLKNCRQMLIRGKNTNTPIFQYVTAEISYRQWKKLHKEDDKPTTRFDLIDLE